MMIDLREGFSQMNIFLEKDRDCSLDLKGKLIWLRYDIIEKLSVSEEHAENLLEVYAKFLLDIKCYPGIYFAAPKIIDEIIHIHALRTSSFQKFFEENFEGRIVHRSEIFGSNAYWSSVDFTNMLLRDDKEKYIKFSTTYSSIYNECDMFSSCLIMLDNSCSKKMLR